MGKIKTAFRNMSLKKSLVLLAAFWLGLASVLSVAAILICSDIRQKILDTRPILVTDYTMDAVHSNMEIQDGVTVVPKEYVHGELSKEYRIYYGIVTVLMAVFPVVYIILAAILLARSYYKLKLQIPIGELKKSMDHISEQDVDFQMQYDSEDEMGKLCSTFEQMKNEIHKSNREMWEMLQERKALTASVSHDLRTPITVINGYLDYLGKTLERETLTEEILQTTIQNMTDAAHRLESYVDCVKNLQKLEDIEVNAEWISFQKFMEDRSREFSLLAAANGKILIMQNETEAEMIETDSILLSKILENIFDNALRFARQQILLKAWETEKNYVIEIRDDGSGFSAEDLKSSISLFYSSPANGGSFGIGLSVCDRLCKKINGQMQLKNTPNGGASVILYLEKTKS